MIRTTLSYDRSFWRKTELNGAIIYNALMGREGKDTSYETGGRLRLAAFRGGLETRQWAQLRKGWRKNSLLAKPWHALGKAAPRSIDANQTIRIDGKWNCSGHNDFVRSRHSPGIAQQLLNWPGPGRFAGTELDDTCPGYLEGVIRRGRRTAYKVLADVATVPS